LPKALVQGFHKKKDADDGAEAKADIGEVVLRVGARRSHWNEEHLNNARAGKDSSRSNSDKCGTGDD